MSTDVDTGSYQLNQLVETVGRMSTGVDYPDNNNGGMLKL